MAVLVVHDLDLIDGSVSRELVEQLGLGERYRQTSDENLVRDEALVFVHNIAVVFALWYCSLDVSRLAVDDMVLVGDVLGHSVVGEGHEAEAATASSIISILRFTRSNMTTQSVKVPNCSK